MNRRRFIALIGAAVPGLWIDQIGLIQLPRQMVISLSGLCSFCGKDAREVFGLAGVLNRRARICNECIDICIDTLAADVQMVLVSPDEPPADYLLPSSESSAVFDFEAIGSLKGTEQNDEMRQIVVDPDGFIEVIRQQLDLSKLPVPKPKDISHLACSFCDRNQSEAHTLIAGPQVHICDICIGDAVALLNMHS
jgi:hypothetical protein